MMQANICGHEPHRTSPLLLGAAVAVVILSAVGIGAVTGVIPNALSDRDLAPEAPPAASAIEPAAASACLTCGTIASIRAVEIRYSPPAPDAGEPAATILSAAGGLFAGQEFQRAMRKRYAYRITLRMDDGSYRTFSEAAPPRFAVGEKVRVVDGTLSARS